MDRELRQAERNARGTLNPRLLRAKMRSGQITWERVKLAAQLGNPTAQTLFPDEPLVNWADWTERKNLLKEAEKELGKPKIVEFAADVAERTLHIFEAKHPEDLIPREAIVAARAWAKCPCEKHRNEARAAAAAAAAYAAYADAYAAAYADAADAAASAAADAAASAAAASARKVEFEWQKQRLSIYLLNVNIKAKYD